MKVLKHSHQKIERIAILVSENDDDKQSVHDFMMKEKYFPTDRKVAHRIAVHGSGCDNPLDIVEDKFIIIAERPLEC